MFHVFVLDGDSERILAPPLPQAGSPRRGDFLIRRTARRHATVLSHRPGRGRAVALFTGTAPVVTTQVIPSRSPSPKELLALPKFTVTALHIAACFCQFSFASRRSTRSRLRSTRWLWMPATPSGSPPKPGLERRLEQTLRQSASHAPKAQEAFCLSRHGEVGGSL